MNLEGKRILVTGGTGSLGKVLVRRLLGEELGKPAKIIVFSRDEAKQHAMRVHYKQLAHATDEIIYRNFEEVLDFRIGDVRDYSSIAGVLRNADIVFNAAALKQVPTCEYFPFEAVLTNIAGPQNIARAIREHNLPVELVVGVSTDKACQPVNVMGMTKAIQERVFITANLDQTTTRYICVRYGNVLASRGSVIPLFTDQIRNGGPVTITMKEMTRFLLSLDQAVDTIFAGVKNALPGETFIPNVPSARIIDIATLMIGKRDIPIEYTGIRPGEKIHEVLISAEECFRSSIRGDYYVIHPILPELRSSEASEKTLNSEFSSRDHTFSLEELRTLLSTEGYLEV